MNIELIKIAQDQARKAYELEMTLTARARRELSRLRDDLDYQKGLVRAETSAIRKAIKAQAESESEVESTPEPQPAPQPEALAEVCA